MPQMYCKRCGIPASTLQSVSDECIGCKVADWVTDESEITWDAIRNTCGSAEIMKETLERGVVCMHCKSTMTLQDQYCGHCGAKDSKMLGNDGGG